MSKKNLLYFTLLLTSLCVFACSDPDNNTPPPSNQKPNDTTLCQNGTKDPNEECDTNDFGSHTCQSINANFNAGTLKCTAECKIDTSNCLKNDTPSTPICGDGIINTADEECDKNDLNNKKCTDINPDFKIGILSCTDKCKLSTTECLKDTDPKPTCNNGIKELGEACDTNDFGTHTCQSSNPNKPMGTLTCAADCSAITTENCKEASSTASCGDGLINASDEECDKNDLNNKKCSDINPDFTSGALSCTDKCKFSTENCLKNKDPKPTCNNGVLETGEKCDTNNFNGATCKTLLPQKPIGTLLCSKDCKKIITDNCQAQELPLKWCSVVEPIKHTFNNKTDKVMLKMQIIVTNITDKTQSADPNPNLKVKLTFGSNPKKINEWFTIDATPDTSFKDQDKDQYIAEIAASDLDTDQEYFTFKASDDNGKNWVFCKIPKNGNPPQNYDFHNVDPNDGNFSPNVHTLASLTRSTTPTSNIVAKWDFDNKTLNASMGTGIAVKGNQLHTPNPEFPSDLKGGSSWNLRNWKKHKTDALKLNTNNFTIQNLDATNHKDLNLYFQVYRTSTKDTPTHIAIAYSLDNKEYHTLPNDIKIYVPQAAEELKQFYKYDITLPKELNQQKLFHIQFSPYGNGNSNLRFDDIIVTGTPIH